MRGTWLIMGLLLGAGCASSAGGDGGGEGPVADAGGSESAASDAAVVDAAAVEAAVVDAGAAEAAGADAGAAVEATPSPAPVADGGIYGRCLGEGEEFEAKVLGAACCEGLRAIGTEAPTVDGCRSADPPSIRVCARCGDRTCARKLENSCNCPEDCAP